MYTLCTGLHLQFFFKRLLIADKEPGTIDQEPGTTDRESDLDPAWTIIYTLMSILVAFTIFGLIYMCRTNCQIRKTCCPCCVDQLEKTDENLDYGTYYDITGERWQNVMEVIFF